MLVTSPKYSQRPFSVALRVRGIYMGLSFIYYLSEQLNFWLILQAQFDCPCIDNSSVTRAGFIGPTIRRAHTWFNVLLCHLKILNKFWTQSPTFSFCTGPAYYVVILTAAKETVISGFGVTLGYSFRVLSHPLSHVILTIKQPEKERKWWRHNLEVRRNLGSSLGSAVTWG